MNKKEPRNSILYVRIKKSNAKWIKQTMKKLRYKSKSEFVDHLIANKLAPKKEARA